MDTYGREGGGKPTNSRRAGRQTGRFCRQDSHVQNEGDVEEATGGGGGGLTGYIAIWPHATRGKKRERYTLACRSQLRHDDASERRMREKEAGMDGHYSRTHGRGF